MPQASERQFSSTLSALLISSHGGLTKYAEKVVISETGETFITFLDKLRTNYTTILQTQTNLTNDSMLAYIKKNFPIALTNYVSFKLNYSEAEKEVMLANLVRAFSDEFMMHLVMFKPNLNGNWCFLQLVTLSITFLILNTDLYIHNFIQYYFNEIFINFSAFSTENLLFFESPPIKTTKKLVSGNFKSLILSGFLSSKLFLTSEPKDHNMFLGG